MRKTLSILPMLVLTNLCFASNNANDLCSKTPGHWQGIYSLKQPELCAANNGCTHLVLADVIYMESNHFQIKLNPVVGQGSTFTIICEDGVISSPVNPGNKISLNCDKQNHCTVLYEDNLLIAEMANG